MKEKRVLNLAIPEIISGQIKNGGTMDAYRFLHVSSALDRACLESDINAGAKQFESVLNVSADDMGRYIVIKADSEEEGLIAVSYLNNILTTDKSISEQSIDDWLMSEDDDFEDDEFEYDDVFSEEISLSEIIGDECNIPVIEFNEAYRNISIKNQRISYTTIADMEAFAPQMNVRAEPYWFNINDKSICLVRHMSNGENYYNDYDEKVFNFFSCSRNVFYLIVCDDSEYDYEYDEDLISLGTEYDSNDDINNNKETDVSLTKMLIKYTADVVDVRMNMGFHGKYLRLVFDTLLKENGIKLSDEEEAGDIIQALIKIDKNVPAYNMDKTLKYLRHKDKTNNEISIKKLTEIGVMDIVGKDDEVVDSLDNLVGLSSVKKEIESIVMLMKYHKERRLNGIKNSEFHNVFQFIGAPGTAKTTVAKAFGRMMKKNNLLKRTRFISINGAELKGQYVGHTAPKIKKLFESYDIILIDEAYSIAASDHGVPDTFSQEALAQLAIELEEHSKDKLIIFAGYGGEDISGKNNKMKEFLDSNPGIASRINETIRFESYTPMQMVQIVHHFINGMNIKMVNSADKDMEAYFAKFTNSPNFGNGRDARRFADQLVKHMAVRVMEDRDDTLGFNKKSRKTVDDIVTKKDVINTISYLNSAGRTASDRRYGI